MSYLYETHLHTSPVSKCAKVSPEETVRFYKELGYDGIFITNHFVNNNCSVDHDLSWEDQIRYYFSDYHKAKEVGDQIGIKVFPGVEAGYGGTDFLIFGLDEEFYVQHPEMMDLDMRARLHFFADNGAFISHAHPFREASYIDHIRLYPDCVEAVEVINANRSGKVNDMARLYADTYEFLYTAGSDNHTAGGQKFLAGMKTETPIVSVEDFIAKVRNHETEIFTIQRD